MSLLPRLIVQDILLDWIFTLLGREIDSDTHAPCFSLAGVVLLSAIRLQASRLELIIAVSSIAPKYVSDQYAFIFTYTVF
ncbi:hypothetical protein SynSYN20_02942 [Synechococcus sp. SYN20]|nr:hypothetical protein SynSYN20_02942 [Synechococcus sp. SYN20]